MQKCQRFQQIYKYIELKYWHRGLTCIVLANLKQGETFVPPLTLRVHIHTYIIIYVYSLTGQVFASLLPFNNVRTKQPNSYNQTNQEKAEGRTALRLSQQRVVQHSDCHSRGSYNTQIVSRINSTIETLLHNKSEANVHHVKGSNSVPDRHVITAVFTHL